MVSTWPLTKADFADKKKLIGLTKAALVLLLVVATSLSIKIIFAVEPFLPTSLAKLLLKPISAWLKAFFSAL